MPKIIENLDSRLIEEAQKQIREDGYSAMTIRSVAKACGVGIGTVYNYFSSKEELIAAFLLEDWKQCISTIQTVAAGADSLYPVAQCIHDQLRNFSLRHAAIFRDEAAASGFVGSFSRYHGLLRSQLARPIRNFCDSDYASQFIAEALLTWTMNGTSFDEIYGMIHRLV